jgi:hypothetical protein
VYRLVTAHCTQAGEVDELLASARSLAPGSAAAS